MSDDTSRQFATGRTGVLGGSRLPPSLVRLTWLERPDPDSARADLARLVAARSPTDSIVNDQLTTPLSSGGESSDLDG